MTGYQLLAPDPGSVTGAWTALTLGASITNTASGGFAAGGVRLEQGGATARLQGRIEPTGNVSNGDVLATIPVGWRPLSAVSFPGRWSGGTAILTVGTDGTVKLAQSLTAGQWLSLDGVTYPRT